MGKTLKLRAIILLLLLALLPTTALAVTCGNLTSVALDGALGHNYQFAYTKCVIATTTTFTTEYLYVKSYTAGALIQLGVWDNTGNGGGYPGAVVCGAVAYLVLIATGWVSQPLTGTCTLNPGTYYLGTQVLTQDMHVGYNNSAPSHNGGSYFNSGLGLVTFGSWDCTGCALDWGNYIQGPDPVTNKIGMPPPMMR